MGKLVISENVSLDGVVQDPTGEEGFPRGGWFVEVSDRDRQAWVKVALDEASRAEALLLGRGSDQFFGSRWPSRSGEFAETLNNLPKYVVSSTLHEPVWKNSTVLNGDAVHAVSGLKETVDGDVVVYASRQLVNTLVEHDLADELRLMVYPVVLGAGKRLFNEIAEKKPMRLLDMHPVGESLAHLTYEFVHKP